MSEHEPVRLVLTPDQRMAIRRLSGRDVQVIELTADGQAMDAGPLQFRWRLSQASGIPRQAWTPQAAGVLEQRK